MTVGVSSLTSDSDRGEGEITNPCIRCALITSYFQELMDVNKIDDHDLILQNLAGMQH